MDRTFCPSTTAGEAETGLHTSGLVSVVVDWSENPSALVGQVKTRFVPERLRMRGGGTNKLNAVPEPPAPPACVTPNRVLLDKMAETGPAPSALVALFNAVKL